MADRFVSSTGSNTSPYDTWAKAARTLATAITGSANGDKIVVDVTNPPADIAASTTQTFVANVSVIASTNSGTATITPTPMGTTSWLGNSGVTSYVQVYQGAFKVYFYGITFRSNGAGTANFQFNASDGGHFEFEECYFWDGISNTTQRIDFGNPASTNNQYTRLLNCTLRFNNANHQFRPSGCFHMEGGSVSSAGTAPTGFITFSVVPAATQRFTGVDLSFITGTLIVGASTIAVEAIFERCKFGAGVTVLGPVTPANKSSAMVYVLDCASGDTHGLFGYYDSFGSVVSDTGIYYTSGPANQSWKIVTTANCSYATPFVTPWIANYNDALSSITPYLEILRNGSATAYQDNEVWAEFAAKVTSGSTQATLYKDRMALAGTPANQAAGAGLGSWTGESGTAWSGKIDSGSSFTPAELGDISARISVGAPSITVYVDPFIRV